MKKWIKRLLKPQNATLYISNVCNSRCPTCTIWKNKTPIDQPLDNWIKVLKSLKDIGVTYLSISGGEPLLYPDIVQLIETAKKMGFCFVDLCTNGILLVPDVISNLSGAGLDRVIISIDGIGALHDKLRATPNNFYVIQEALPKLQESTIDVLIQTNLLRENIRVIPEIIELVNTHSALWGLNLINNTQYYFKNIPRDNLIPTNQVDITVLLSFLALQISKPETNVTIKKEHLPFLDQILRSFSIPDYIPCILGNHYIYVSPNLDIFPGCNALPAVGNLRQLSLQKIISNDRYKKRVISMHQRHCPGCTCGIWSNIDAYLQGGGESSPQ